MPAKSTRNGGRQAIEERITATILGALEQGVAPWRQSWKPTRFAGNRQQNAISHHAYRGINALTTQTVALTSGYSDPRWLTYRQAESKHGHVRKGEHGTPIALWKPFEKETDEDGERKVRTFMAIRYYSIFNVAQCDGLDLPAIATDAEECTWDPIAAAETVVDAYTSDGGPAIVEVPHGAGQPPFWSPGADRVNMPLRAQFPRGHEFYGVLFHELTHSTGHRDRLNRKESTGYGHGDNRGREELVAEFGAAFLAGNVGLDNSLNGTSASYIDSWRRVISADRAMLIVAAQRAQKAADLILGETPER